MLEHNCACSICAALTDGSPAGQAIWVDVDHVAWLVGDAGQPALQQLAAQARALHLVARPSAVLAAALLPQRAGLRPPAGTDPLSTGPLQGPAAATQVAFLWCIPPRRSQQAAQKLCERQICHACRH